MQATAENVSTLDFVWVNGRAYTTATEWVSQLPWQGPRYYHISAVLFMLSNGICAASDLGLGFRATGRYPPILFEAPLDSIAAALPEH